jgi:hypothetical protein
MGEHAKLNFKNKQNVMPCNGLNWKEPARGSCDHGNDISGSIKMGYFLTNCATTSFS